MKDKCLEILYSAHLIFIVLELFKNIYYRNHVCVVKHNVIARIFIKFNFKSYRITSFNGKLKI